MLFDQDETLFGSRIARAGRVQALLHGSNPEEDDEGAAVTCPLRIKLRNG
ncbi:MAG: hypothetical protein NVSMB65_19520 [Chloroflexota bacterium]